jgi:Tol biopolymer transport system component
MLFCLISIGVAVSARAEIYAFNADAQELAPGVISTGHEFGVSFTLDGKEVYFSRTAAGVPIHIYRSHFSYGKWQEPEQITLSGGDWSDLDPFVSPDGKHLFFVTTRGKPTADGQKNMDIWQADRDGEDWVRPRPVENVNSDAKEGSPTVAGDGTLYFFSDRDGEPGTNALYVSKLVHGKYTAPVKLPPNINSDASDTSPFITPDGGTLLFYSTRAGGFGNADLYVAHKIKTGWNEPRNLGPQVNTPESEYNPALSPDGRTLFFGRNRRIYFIDTQDLELGRIK